MLPVLIIGQCHVKTLSLSAVCCHDIKRGRFCHLGCVVTRTAPLRKLALMNGRVSGVPPLRSAAVRRLPLALSSSMNKLLHVIVSDCA